MKPSLLIFICTAILTISCHQSAEQVSTCSRLTSYSSTFQLDSCGNQAFRLIVNAGGIEDTFRISGEEAVHIAATSTTQLGYLSQLDQQNSVMAFPNLDLIYDTLYSEDSILDLGSEVDWNTEKVLEVNPDYLLISDNPLDNRFTAIRAAGIQVIPLFDYLEASPLGRAEYIKLYGALTGTYSHADSVFKSIVNRYQVIKSDTLLRSNTIISGFIYGGNWYAPGGNSYMAQFFEDSGGNYLYREDSAKGSIQVSLEKIIEDTDSSTLWIGVADFTSLDQLSQFDRRISLLPFVRPGHVYTFNKRKRNDAIDYFESGYARPDLILQDIKSILTEANTSTLHYFRELQ